MKLIKKITAIVVIAVALFSVAGINAFAATDTQDGLEVTLTTDKEAYSKDEKITATLLVKNTNKTDVFNVFMENIVPDGYKVDDFTNTKQLETLAPNETLELKSVYVSESTNEVSKDDNTTIDTGDNTLYLTIIISVTVCSLILIVFGIRKKKIKKFLSIAISISILGSVATFLTLSVDAVEESEKTISVSQRITIDSKDTLVKANVGYSCLNDDSSNDLSENEADTYYNENAKVISVIKAKESDNLLSEQEVTKLLSARVFDTENIVTDYTMDGEYLDGAEIDKNSEEKHPLYKMLYASKSEILWNIYVINGVVSAYPVSYNLVSDRQAVLLITETDTVTSYDYISNQFYETIPKESSLITRKIDKIDKETLDDFTIGGLSKL